MRGEFGFQHLGSLQLDRLSEVIEEPRASAENDRRHVEVKAVHQPSLQGLLDHAGTAHDMYLLVAGGGPRLCDRRLDAVGDERKGRLAFHDHIVGTVREHEDRHPIEPVLAPSFRPVVNLATGNHGSRGGEQRIVEEVRAVGVLPKLGVEDLAPLPEPWVLVDVRSGDETIH